MDEKHKSVKLVYKIHKFSSYCAYYIPENILVNNPTDQLSRWFTDNTTPPQFITLKLNSPAIVETILFGKYMKSHVGNLKKFQVFGGTDENNLSLLLSAGLKNDNIDEVFRLRHRTQEGLYLPVTYIKIVPLQSWGPAYNYTIWYVELKGKNHEELITNALETINLRKEEEAVRILLKHLRRRQYKDAFEALTRESGVQLEGPTQSKLWNALVENGDFKLAEKIFDEAVDDGELDWYLSWQPYTPEWRLMSACSSQVEARFWSGPEALPVGPPSDLLSADRDLSPMDSSGVNGDSVEMEAACGPGGCCSKPGPRGGHQLVVDSTTGTLYLFGGWNGTEDLDDLWSYDTTEEKWALLCRHSQLVGGPSPRSCHKMVFDPVHRKLYTLGRYLDNAQRVPSNMNSDLYVYDVNACSWSLVCLDTAACGGPRLVFDHQMCIDPDSQTIYVFGGRVLPANTEEVVTPQYSGLYAYYITTGTWQLLLDDKHEEPAPKPRVSHSMLFHPVQIYLCQIQSNPFCGFCVKEQQGFIHLSNHIQTSVFKILVQRRLYILGGQRNKSHLAELWWWEVGAGRGAALAACACAPPPQGFTQRATIDPDTDDIFVLSGMTKEKEKRVYNTLWVFSLRRRVWTCIYRNDTCASDEPRPRFAHQLVYDPVRKVHYLFGGNPGAVSNPRLRLDDLWSLRLSRGDAEAARRRARAALRLAQYRALAALHPARALHYLRHDLREVIDLDQPQQLAKFHSLPTALFASRRGVLAESGAPAPLSPRRVRALARRRRAHAPQHDLAHSLKQVLGAEDYVPEQTVPYEEISEAEVETWDVGEDEDAAPPHGWDARHERLKLYDTLCAYFRPSTVPPQAELTDLVTL